MQFTQTHDTRVGQLGATGVARHEGADLRCLVREKRGDIEGAELNHFKQTICGRSAAQQIRRFGACP